MPQGKCSFMRKAKSGVSELMRDFTLKGGWDTLAHSGSLWASCRIDFAFLRHKTCSKHWLLAGHTVFSPGQGGVCQSRDAVMCCSPVHELCLLHLPFSRGWVSAPGTMASLAWPQQPLWGLLTGPFGLGLAQKKAEVATHPCWLHQSFCGFARSNGYY